MMLKNFHFFTAAILNWVKALEEGGCEVLIPDSFRFMANDNRIRIFFATIPVR